MRNFSIDIVWAKIQMAVAAIGGWMGYFLGGRLEALQFSKSAMPTASVEFGNSSAAPLDGLMIALIIFMVLDYITGLMCAIVDKKLSSAVGFKGICKKVLILMLVCVANVVNIHIVGTGSALRSAVICFYLSNEGLSLLENADHIGMPIPDKMKDVLAQLHGGTDEKKDDAQEFKKDYEALIAEHAKISEKIQTSAEQKKDKTERGSVSRYFSICWKNRKSARNSSRGRSWRWWIR